MSAETREPELTEPVDLCNADGTLNRAAVGWSRRPLHRCNLTGRWPRKKRWDFWAVTSDECQFQMTYASVDYLGLVECSLLDLETRRRTRKALVVPLAAGWHMPETVGGGDMRFDALGLAVSISEEAEGTRLRAALRGRHRLEADILVTMPPGHETLSVVVPWGDRAFQYTSKHNTRPAVGAITLDGRTYEMGRSTSAFGCLDYGRGIWPYHTTWNWGSASGVQAGRTVGIQVGGKWTDGTGMTETGCCVDGRVHKVGEPLTWDWDKTAPERPWHLRAPESGRVDLEFTPLATERQHFDIGVLRTDIVWAWGLFDGTLVLDDGEKLAVDGLAGWVEEHDAKW